VGAETGYSAIRGEINHIPQFIGETYWLTLMRYAITPVPDRDKSQRSDWPSELERHLSFEIPWRLTGLPFSV
jgi:hypothetical protein